MKKKIEYCWLIRDPKGFIIGSGDSKDEALASFHAEFLDNCSLCYTRLEHIFTDDGEYIRTNEFTENTSDLTLSN